METYALPCPTYNLPNVAKNERIFCTKVDPGDDGMNADKCLDRNSVITINPYRDDHNVRDICIPDEGGVAPFEGDGL